MPATPDKPSNAIIVTDEIFPSSSAQGTRVDCIVSALIQTNHSLSVISLKDIGDASSASSSLSPRYNLDHDGIPPKLFTYSGILELVFHCYSIASTTTSPSFIYVSSRSPLTHLIVLSVSYLFKSVSTIDVGELYSIRDFLRNLEIKNAFIEFLHQSVFYRLYSCCLAISSPIARVLAKRHITCLILPSLVKLTDTETLTSTQSTFKAFPTTKSHLNLVYTGTLKPEDGLDVLLDVLSSSTLPYGFKLLTCGNISLDQIRQTARQNRIDINNVHMIHYGWLGPDEYHKLIHDSDLVVIPRPSSYSNNKYSFPTRLPLALSIGTPVAISDTSDIPRLLVPDQEYLSVRDGSYNNIKAALSRDDLLPLLQSIRLNTRDAARKFDSVSNISRILNQLFPPLP